MLVLGGLFHRKDGVCTKSLSQEFPCCGTSPQRRILFLRSTCKLKLSEQCLVSTAQLGYHSEETASSLGSLLTTAVQRGTALEKGDFFVTHLWLKGQTSGFLKHVRGMHNSSLPPRTQKDGGLYSLRKVLRILELWSLGKPCT